MLYLKIYGGIIFPNCWQSRIRGTDCRRSGFNQLDYVVATHNHNDHAGRETDVVTNLDVGNLYLTNSEETTASKT